MELSDFSKDVKRFLLEHWSKAELTERLKDAPYFFEHVVLPRMEYLKRQGEDVPKIRLKQTPTGQLNVILNP